ncbi:MAG: MBOAT family protein [Lachnospiraceae bacterium]|nr:MBOAT family protein [Lachnospiraceae bacterium]
MIFNSFEFLIFFPIVVMINFILPQKIRYIWLLLASWYFYMSWNPVYIILLLTSTTVTYIAGLCIEYDRRKKQKDSIREKRRIGKKYLVISLIILLGILGFFKYFDFILNGLNMILSIFRAEAIKSSFSIVLPVGISFYTLQSIGYLIDVYRGDIYAEKNFLRYALFVSFFPQLVAGPIERSKNLLVQLYKPQRFSWDNCARGILLMLYGFFLKVVIADKAAIIVNTVYENPMQYPGFYIAIATFFFAMQIYCDFYGYSTIARGAALVFGIKLMSNFEAPYFSRGIKEFWRRWHISLSGWFMDYLYIPLGGNRKGWLRQQGNLMTVFAVSGLWHGASIAFVIWGVLNGAYQVVGNICKKIKEKMDKLLPQNTESISVRIRQRVTTFLLVGFAWMFFRAGTWEVLQDVWSNLFHFNWYVLLDGSIYELGVTEEFFRMLLFFIVILFAVDYKKYKGCDVVEAFMRQEWWFRLVGYVLLLFVIILFGCYGVEYDTSQFIYFQF